MTETGDAATPDTPAPSHRLSPARLKWISLLVIAVLSGALLLAWSQQWFSIVLADRTLTVNGDVGGPALSPLALAGLALVAALAIAGPFFRVVLGILEALLGVTTAVSTWFVLATPLAVAGSAVTKVTGVSGTGSIAALVSSVTPTAWPTVAVAVGVLMTLAGIAVAVTSRAWPTSGRKYTRSRLASPDGASNPVDEWDALSEGEDPTAR